MFVEIVTKKFNKISDIGNQPIAVSFEEKENIKNFSLNLYKCNFCNLVQLSRILTKGYVWIKLWI